MTTSDKVKYWLPTLAWMALIFTFSSIPTVQTSGIHWQDFLTKKTAHFIEYFILAWLLFRSLRLTSHSSLPILIIITLTLTILYATSDEYHQTYVFGREGRIRDVVIDSLGALTAGLIILQARHSLHLKV